MRLYDFITVFIRFVCLCMSLYDLWMIVYDLCMIVCMCVYDLCMCVWCVYGFWRMCVRFVYGLCMMLYVCVYDVRMRLERLCLICVYDVGCVCCDSCTSLYDFLILYELCMRVSDLRMICVLCCMIVVWIVYDVIMMCVWVCIRLYDDYMSVDYVVYYVCLNDSIWVWMCLCMMLHACV